VNKLSKLYEHILEGLYTENKIVTEKQKEEFLQNLQFNVRDLRSGYKNSCVQADYRDKSTQAAYLLAYYPQYAEMTYAILERQNFKRIPLQDKVLKVCLFGAGPAPEIPALLDFFSNQKSLQVNSIIVYAYDIAASNWGFSHNIVRKFVVPKIWTKQFEFVAFDLDLCSKNVFSAIKTKISGSHLFLFQNCLNELSQTRVAIQNIESLIQEMSKKSILIIADLANYKGNLDVKAEIKNRIRSLGKESFFICSHNREKIILRSEIPIPQSISQNLLVGTDSLIPRRKVEFNFISIYHQLPEDIQDVIPDSISLESLQTHIVKLQTSLLQMQQEVSDLSGAENFSEY
jgi:hypothetical protein